MDPRRIEMSLQTPLFVVFMGHSFQGIHSACPLNRAFDCFVIEQSSHCSALVSSGLRQMRMI